MLTSGKALKGEYWAIIKEFNETIKCDVFRTDVSNNRKPKLFFVSSASTTSTVKTDAVCYVSTSAAGFTLASCKRRRKRAFISEGKHLY